MISWGPMSDLSDIEALVAARKKIHAIKEVRALTGLGLKDAKEAVEWFEVHGEWPTSVSGAAASQGAMPTSSGPTTGGPTPGSSRRAEIEQLMARQQKIGAIKVLRELTRWGLRESKEAVDYYDAHHAWRPDVLAFFGESAIDAPPQPRAAQDAGPASLTQALTQSLGYAPDVQLAVRAQRAGQDGWLVMLRDRAVFVGGDAGQERVEAEVAYDAVSHVEVEAGMRAVLYVSLGKRHERFELSAADADAALALFRVFAC